MQGGTANAERKKSNGVTLLLPQISAPPPSSRQVCTKHVLLRRWHDGTVTLEDFISKSMGSHRRDVKGDGAGWKGAADLRLLSVPRVQ